MLANSPSLAPSPVKSKRSTAMPRMVSPSAMRFAASTSLPQVKQCANSAYAIGSPDGPVQHGGELFAARIGKFEAFGWHGHSPDMSHGWALLRLRTIAPMILE